MIKRRLKAGFLNATLLGVSLVAALMLVEGTSRIFYPISDGADNVALDGKPLRGWTMPGSVYRQVGSEYNALTTITDKAHRVPVVERNPDIVFLGDSFTFGWGLNDDETFVSIFCTATGLDCANLGHPGTGTARQLDRLEMFLERWDWHPSHVKLFMLAMTSSFSAGNDLHDNYQYVRRTAEAPGRRWAERRSGERDLTAGDSSRRAQAEGDTLPIRDEVSPGVMERMLGLRGKLQEHSNLVRIVKYHWGPLLRSSLVPGLDEQRLSEALAVTKAELDRLDGISRDYGFEYSIYLLHPVQDIIRSTDTETLAALNQISRAPIYATAHLFRDSPASFYYPYDGHMNAAGSRQIADFLITEWTQARDDVTLREKH